MKKVLYFETKKKKVLEETNAILERNPEANLISIVLIESKLIVFIQYEGELNTAGLKETLTMLRISY